jgi:hypothetical protein
MMSDGLASGGCQQELLVAEELSQKGAFLRQKRKNEVGIDKPVEIRKSYEASNKADSGDKERTNQQ